MPHAARRPWSWLIFDVRQNAAACFSVLTHLSRGARFAHCVQRERGNSHLLEDMPAMDSPSACSALAHFRNAALYTLPSLIRRPRRLVSILRYQCLGGNFLLHAASKALSRATRISE